MGLLSVFCTNSINILAGINGLEVRLATFQIPLRRNVKELVGTDPKENMTRIEDI